MLPSMEVLVVFAAPPHRIAAEIRLPSQPEAPRYSRLQYAIREVRMHEQPFDSSGEERTQGHTHNADHEVFDEDSLREEQPYAELEDELRSSSTPDSAEPEGGGSW